MKKGFYIIFEGCHGTGKSTQSRALQFFLQKKFPQKEVIWTREPGGTEVAEAIRRLVQGTRFLEEMNPICEAYLYAASRAHSLRTVIQPVLEKGGIVVQDNSFITSLTYQGFGRKLGIEKVLEINKTALDNFLPDVVVFLKLALQTARSRAFDREGDKFENKDLEFDKIIERGYGKISKLPMFKGKWLNVDAQGEIGEVFTKILKRITK